MASTSLTQRLQNAARRREHLHDENTTLYRLAHLSETDGEFTLERAGEVGVLSFYREAAGPRERELATLCGETLGLKAVYLKRRPPEARHVANIDREYLSPRQAAWGEAHAEVVALEHGVPFLIRPGGDLSIGLFSDMRPARRWLREHGRESLLNTFSYTCGFGVMASLAGGQRVKNLDASRKVLTWGQQNYALSSLPCREEDFVYGDVFDWLARFAKRGVTFEQVVLDPPSFARGKSGIWRAEKDYASLVALACRVTATGGQLLACTNHAGLEAKVFERMVGGGLHLAGRQGRVTARLGAGDDYPQASHLKVLVVQLDRDGGAS
ncbi:class I SAM-dependent rRNA methyltransferase [Deinococcus peraridilitoris]|uniref:Putative SAM-dependent methyltransferase n=1 Tax=Deinococcus peraridilitoris (strain DSM 19664 / LMG 22246 / CIP 109416 / KR-200) TaxID=937777 RepID=L0A4C1_DEIPD|nr:class I SAM-dependent methyltransferase [Deinococcus peraridilitoris]AFZ68733.1 putative SAM-dependent methyltransferase [Deinococcus peraridilitoris DSM 19664]